ncbi:hypothetical protein ATANTOWER_002076 [Ataeniobius toweri]|uniref:RING-type E3 ubiquitin transferase n=1 Tax=Ataeniobius toweri TaxID=208326 RepID=A0ABU7A0V9_9TELE|nr:hypothetical protein [Ataeniobius toweri]
MPLPARSSSRRRRNGPDEEERAANCSVEVMAPTRMKLRERRRNTAAEAAPAGGASLAGDAERTRESRRSSRKRNCSKASASADAAPSSSSSPPSTSSGTTRPAVAAEASPDSKCPICLDRFNNLAYLDHCLHRFCFHCIQEWSHNKAECPLCKQPFASILHSVRAEDDFKEYTLQPPRTNSQLTASTFLTTVAAMTSDGSTQHHLRLMLRRHLVAADRENIRRRRRRERAASGRRSNERMGEWEFFMPSPPLPVSPYHLDMSEIIMENMGVEEDMRRRDEERRLVFNELTGLRGAAAPPAAPSTRASRRLMCRLAVRQRLQREGGTIHMGEREVIAFRKALYQCGIRAQGISGNQGRQRAITAESFRRSTSHLNRLHIWLRRELTVLLGSHASLTDVVQRTVVARVLRSGLEDAAAMEEELRPFLSARTEHFVHELVSFARSTLRMESYDQQAVYEPPPTAMELDQVSTPSDGSSVIAISEGEDEGEERGGRSEGAGGSNDDVIRAGSSLSLSGWDDETPGPSYTTAEPSHSLTFSPAPQDSANQEGGERHAEEEECLIVGYKKPIAERTPELVQLSSDSEEGEGEKKKKEEDAVVASETVKKAPPSSSSAPPSSNLPIIPPSTSGAFRAEHVAGQKQSETGQRSHSWSESSGRSTKSVCSLSPATPEWRRRDRKQHGERRKKKKRRQDGSREHLRRSGTFCNPNRSIFPPMMSRCSPSPFDYSADSASSLSQSPRDSSWDFRLTQVSPLTSSVSSTSPSRSISPLCSSPPQTPPTPAFSPKRPHHVEKPGGKRKYKSRHLNSSNKDPSWRPNRSQQREREHKKRRKIRREALGRENSSLKTGNRRSREDRSPSVEIIYEGTIASSTTQPSAHKWRRRRHRRTHLSSSPVIITLDSDSSHDDVRRTNSASSSPLSSQQTIDFSDLPSLPMLHSTDVGGNMDAELPADILDRGSDGSESEAAARSRAARRVENGDSSYVDVINVEDSVSLLETSDDQQTAAEPIRAADSKPPGEGPMEPAAVGEGAGPKPFHGRHQEVSSSDRYLLESILSDLNRIAPPRPDLSLNTDSRKPTPQQISQKADCLLEERTRSGPTSNISCQQNQECNSQTRTSSFPPGPPLERTKESRDVPPLLRRASPVRSYNRNTPPPLKHKDAGSPQQCAAFPRDVGPQCSSDADPKGRNSPVLLGLNKHAIPPIATLKNHLNNVWTSTIGAGVPSSSHRLPADSHSSGSDHFPGLGLGSCPSTEFHHSRERLKLSLPADPVNSSHSTDLHPAHRSSTSGGDGNKALGPIRQDLHPSSWDVFSGVNSKDAASFLPDKLLGRSCPEPPAGGGLCSRAASGGQRVSGMSSASIFTPPSDSASHHMALSSSPSQHSSSFISTNTKCSFWPKSHSELFHRSGSHSGPQNHSDLSSNFFHGHLLQPTDSVPRPQIQHDPDPHLHDPAFRPSSDSSRTKASHRTGTFQHNADNHPPDPQSEQRS